MGRKRLLATVDYRTTLALKALQAVYPEITVDCGQAVS